MNRDAARAERLTWAPDEIEIETEAPEPVALSVQLAAWEHEARGPDGEWVPAADLTSQIVQPG
jgi:hypothetical protein